MSAEYRRDYEVENALLKRGVAMAVQDEILELLSRKDGLTIEEIAKKLGKIHQHIYQECRNLEIQGKIIWKREKNRTIRNYIKKKLFEARIYVTLKKGILDPQGKAVKDGLDSMGYHGVADVRVGKFLVLTLDSPDRRQAEGQVREMCDRLLANPVIEDYVLTVENGVGKK